MTRLEAIDELRYCQSLEETSMDLIEAIEMAIEALKSVKITECSDCHRYITEWQAGEYGEELCLICAKKRGKG